MRHLTQPVIYEASILLICYRVFVATDDRHVAKDMWPNICRLLECDISPHLSYETNISLQYGGRGLQCFCCDRWQTCHLSICDISPYICLDATRKMWHTCRLWENVSFGNIWNQVFRYFPISGVTLCEFWLVRLVRARIGAQVAIQWSTSLTAWTAQTCDHRIYIIYGWFVEHLLQCNYTETKLYLS